MPPSQRNNQSVIPYTAGPPAQNQVQHANHSTQHAPAPQHLALPPCRILIEEVDHGLRNIFGILVESNINRGAPNKESAAFREFFWQDRDAAAAARMPTLLLTGFGDERELHTYLTYRRDRPARFIVDWPGYNHLNRIIEVHIQPEHEGSAMAFVQRVIYNFGLVIKNDAGRFQAPGIRLGPNHYPLEMVRLKKLWLVGENIWRGEMFCVG